MAKKLYIGVGNKAKKVKQLYIGVNGKARKVKKAYIGVNGKAKLFYEATSSSSLNLTIKVNCGNLGNEDAVWDLTVRQPDGTYLYNTAITYSQASFTVHQYGTYIISGRCFDPSTDTEYGDDSTTVTFSTSTATTLSCELGN